MLQKHMANILAHLRQGSDPASFLSSYKKNIAEWIASLQSGRNWQITCREQLTPYLASGLDKLQILAADLNADIAATSQEYHDAITVFSQDVEFMDAALRHPRVDGQFGKDLQSLKSVAARVTERLQATHSPAVVDTLVKSAAAVLGKLRVALDSSIQFELQSRTNGPEEFQKKAGELLAAFDAQQV